VERRKHFRRFAWNLLVIVAALGAWVALDRISGQGLGAAKLDPVLLRAGKVIALGVAALFAVRGIFGLIRGLSRRNEFARFYDRGFTWQRGKQKFKYGWGQVKTYREGVRQWRLGRLVLGQVGAQTFTMGDGNVFKFTAVHGNPRRFADLIRPYIADVTGEKMGRALRDDKSIRLHKNLVMASAGIVAGKTKIRWSDLDVTVKRGRLLVKRKDAKGKFKTVMVYPVYQVDNLGGFMELATSTIKNHQPERFNIKTQGPTTTR
jgi:hypothetical protein